MKTKIATGTRMLFSALSLCLMASCRLFDNSGYVVAIDPTIGEFTDSSTSTIFERGDVSYLKESEALNKAFAEAVDVSKKGNQRDDIFSRDVIRRESDGFTIRFGEAFGCRNALIFENGLSACDKALYTRLTNLIDAGL